MADEVLREPAFADFVRVIETKYMADGVAVSEHHAQTPLGHRILRDREAFGELCEAMRLALLNSLRATWGDRINVWRMGEATMDVVQHVNVFTGETLPWNTENSFMIRVRAGRETQGAVTHGTSETDRRS